MAKRWDIKEINILRDLANNGESFKDIGIILNRTHKAVRIKASRLNIKSTFISKPNLKTHDTYVSEINSLNKGFIVLEYYINDCTKINHLCKNNHVFNIKPNDVLQGHGCRYCHFINVGKNSHGAYTDMLESTAKALCYNLYLYHVKLKYKDEIFYKFGLTKNIDRSRYKGFRPYKVIEEISFIEYDAWSAICKEKGLISNYKPKYKFDGFTECYIE